MKKTIGILAHVDAGKTTFSEQALYLTHAIRHLGRVDHRDAFLDDHPMERQRGITIFSGQAVLEIGDSTVYWLDTPGHVDFSAEMERALSVMDAAVLVVSAAEGVQPHTETLWHLLQAYRVPVFVFLNKCDREGADPDGVLRAMRARFSPAMLDCRSWQTAGAPDSELVEAVASLDDALLERFLADDLPMSVWRNSLRGMIARREVFPVMAGSALLGEGVDTFLRLMDELTVTAYDPAAPLAGRVFRVRRDEKGTRLCFVKLTAGALRVKDTLPLAEGAGKINELRVYHGEKYRSVQQAEAGDLVAIPGLDSLRPGDGIGGETRAAFHTEPMLAADVLCPDATPQRLMEALRALEDEDPTLAVEQREGVISARIMGGMQLDILREELADRFGLKVTFGPRRVLYRETVAAPAIGIGHYEPLRHYAEVWLRLCPGEPGSGITFRSLCHVDDLALNWQRLIETHVFEKEHRGVLTGSPLTDVRVELLIGRSHPKHTEGGDFRQAVYRAIRQGLMQAGANNVLLEPICGFELRVPSELYGALTAPLSSLRADCEAPAFEGDTVTVRGEAPYALFAPWQESFLMLTHGRGSLRVWSSRYAPCHNTEEIVAEKAYNPLATLEDTPDSVFCSHGAGYNVPWNEVPAHAHCEWESNS